MVKKINLIIFPGNFVPNLGGLETHVDEFSKYLSKNNNYNITIFTPRLDDSWKEIEIRHKGVKVVRYPAFELISNWPFPKFWKFRFWKLFFNLNSENYDVVMTRTRFFSNTFLGVLFAKLRFKRKKLIHVEHGSSFVILESRVKSFLAKIYDLFFGNFVFLISDKVVAVSKAARLFVEKNFFLGKKRVVVIYRGIDFNEYDKIKISKSLKDKYKNKMIIGSLCRLYKWKGVENSIKAFIDLDLEVKKNLTFLIVGYGEDLSRLKKLASGENNIVFVGKVSYNKAIEYFKLFDIFIHSSYPGGALSTSLLQAMYCNCGIVASPFEGAKEVIKNKFNGVLLKNNSPEEIFNGINFYLNNKEKIVDFSEKSNKYIKENFSWKLVIEKYEKIFEGMIK